MVKVYYCLPIKRFRGTKDINELLCYPVKYHKDGSIENLFAKTRDRGAKYKRIVQSKPGATQMHAYNGNAISESQQIIRSADDDSVSILFLFSVPPLILSDRRVTVNRCSLMTTESSQTCQGGKQSR